MDTLTSPPPPIATTTTTTQPTTSDATPTTVTAPTSVIVPDDDAATTTTTPAPAPSTIVQPSASVPPPPVTATTTTDSATTTAAAAASASATTTTTTTTTAPTREVNEDEVADWLYKTLCEDGDMSFMKIFRRCYKAIPKARDVVGLYKTNSKFLELYPNKFEVYFHWLENGRPGPNWVGAIIPGQQRKPKPKPPPRPPPVQSPVQSFATGITNSFAAARAALAAAASAVTGLPLNAAPTTATTSTASSSSTTAASTASGGSTTATTASQSLAAGARAVAARAAAASARAGAVAAAQHNNNAHLLSPLTTIRILGDPARGIKTELLKPPRTLPTHEETINAVGNAEYAVAVAMYTAGYHGNAQCRLPKQVEKITNIELETRYKTCFNEFKSEGKKVEQMVAFHGTVPDAVDRIVVDGFRIGGQDGIPVRSGASYGRGIYTATNIDMAWPYGQGLTMIIARGILGNMGQIDDGTVDSWSPVSGMRVFRDPKQLLPIYILRF